MTKETILEEQKKIAGKRSQLIARRKQLFEQRQEIDNAQIQITAELNALVGEERRLNWYIDELNNEKKDKKEKEK